MAAKHTPEGDDSFRTSLLRSGAGAVGLIAAVALVFGLIGGLGPSADGPLVADGSGDSSGPAMEPGPDEPEGEETGEEDVAPDDEDAEPVPAPDDEPDEEQAEDEAEPEPDPEPEPAESESDEPEDDATDGAEQDEPDDPDAGDREFAPDSVTVQVLDGYQADGGAAAASVASRLRETGYRVVAENPALRYEVTTVLWTPGFEAQAHQVAADLGGAEVRPKPDNLSDQVQVHVVVGADRA